jgi:hypothetical protein
VPSAGAAGSLLPLLRACTAHSSVKGVRILRVGAAGRAMADRGELKPLPPEETTGWLARPPHVTGHSVCRSHVGANNSGVKLGTVRRLGGSARILFQEEALCREGIVPRSR